MCLVQRNDDWLKQSWSGKSWRSGGGMLISRRSKTDENWPCKYIEEELKSQKPWRGLDKAEDLMRGRGEWILSETRVKGRPMTIWQNWRDSSQPSPSRVDGKPKSDAKSREQRRLNRTSFYEEDNNARALRAHNQVRVDTLGWSEIRRPQDCDSSKQSI